MRANEVLRKSLHVFAGLTPPVFVVVFGWTGAVFIALFLLTYLLVAWDLRSRGILLPIIGSLIARTDRPDDPEPQGAFEFLLAIVIIALLFPLPYSLGAFALLGAGDGVAALAGQRWGRHPLPWNRRKTWEGLLAGTFAGAAAFVAFALLGAHLQLRGYDRMSNLWGPIPAVWSVLFIAVGFPLLHALARWFVSSGRARRMANARPAHVAAAVFLSLVLPLTFLLVAPYWLEGPVLPAWGGHGPVTRGTLLLVPVAAMLAESALRRGDNLVVAGIGAAGAYAVVGLLGGA